MGRRACSITGNIRDETVPSGFLIALIFRLGCAFLPAFISQVWNTVAQ